MKFLSMKKVLNIFLFVIFIVQLSNASLIKDKDYILLSENIPQVEPSKIEVLEFFGYFCIHCYHLQPFLNKEIKKFSNDTYIRKIHVVWNDSYINFAKLAYSASKSGAEEKATNEIFKAIFEDNINLSLPENLKSWLKTQKSWNTNALELAYNSKNSLLEANKMKQITNQYGISKTPIIIVGGKYQLILSQDLVTSMSKLEQLIDKVRKEKNIQIKEYKKNTFNPSVAYKLTILAI